MTVEDNTNSIIAALSGIADAITAGFAEVMAALGVIQGEVAATHSEVEAIHSEVDALSDTVDGLGDQIGAVNSAITAAAASLGPDPRIADIAEGVQANSVSINAITDKLAEVDTMLASIAESVGVVQETVETQETVDPALSNMLHSDDTEQTVAVADFAGTVTKHPADGVYEASNTFSCDGDVFLDSMTITSVDPVLNTVTVITGDNVAPVTTVSLNGVNLYETYDNSGTNPADDTNVLEITKDRDFDNQYLAAGSTLVIKGSTDQSADPDTTLLATGEVTTRGAQNYLEYVLNATAPTADVGRNVHFTLQDYVGLTSNKATLNATDDAAVRGGTNQATKTQLGTTELYTITVNWFAPSSDTTCTISSAVDTAPGLSNAGSALIALNVDEDTDPNDATPAFMPEVLDCKGEDTEISRITIEAGAFLTQYVELTLTAGGESATVKFDGDTSDEDASQLPFRFSGSDLTISGEGINDLLINVHYNTVDKNSCSQED